MFGWGKKTLRMEFRVEIRTMNYFVKVKRKRIFSF